MKRILNVAAISFAISGAALAQPSLPSNLKRQTISTPDGAQIYVRSGGSGPVVLLIHGFGDTGDMWGPVVRDLMKTHTVVVPDLRGMGRSSHPAGGYDKRTQAADMRAVMSALGYDHSAVVGHDIGNMVAYAYTARYPDKVDRLVVIDAPLPGIDPWDAVKCSPNTAAFSKDAEDNQVTQQTKLTMPVLAIGAEKSFGTVMATAMRNVAVDVTGAVVPDSGHWVMEENPAPAVKLIGDFLK